MPPWQPPGGSCARYSRSRLHGLIHPEAPLFHPLGVADPHPSHEKSHPVGKITIPRCSMYGIFTYIWVIFGVNVGKYSIHGASGILSGKRLRNYGTSPALKWVNTYFDWAISHGKSHVKKSPCRLAPSGATGATGSSTGRLKSQFAIENGPFREIYSGYTY